jgi:arginase family enzyme
LTTDTWPGQRTTLKTAAVFFPFDLFGGAGARHGAELLADAFAEMLADNRREKLPARGAAYRDQVRMRQFAFETLPAYQHWRSRGRQAVRQAWRQNEFLLWVTGNHLGVLPVLDEISRQDPDTLVVQFDAHLDIYNLTDCTTELSHGNYLLHVDGPLSNLLHLGHRDLFLSEVHVRKHFRRSYSAAELAIAPERVIRYVRKVSRLAKRVFLDIDCDVLDPAFFPAVANPLPFGLSPQLLLRLLDAAWSERVIGVSLSEFEPGRDRDDRSLATLIWLLEYLLLRRHEEGA